MSANKLGEIIRTKMDEFKTPNIYRHLGGEVVEVHLENFRKNQQDQELILFYQYDKEYYFPIWFEFRAINNNLMFLFYEYEIRDFSVLKKVLTSSLQKEEHYETKFAGLVYETKTLPPFSIHLPGFRMDEEDLIRVKEE